MGVQSAGLSPAEWDYLRQLELNAQGDDESMVLMDKGMARALAAALHRLNSPPTAMYGASEEMLSAGLPHLIGVGDSEVRPVGSFYSGMTAHEAEEYNWRCHGRERLRRAYRAMVDVARKEG